MDVMFFTFEPSYTLLEILLALHFPLILMAFKLPSRLEFPLTSLGVGRDIFWTALLKFSKGLEG